jgi:hypothetical protein
MLSTSFLARSGQKRINTFGNVTVDSVLSAGARMILDSIAQISQQFNVDLVAATQGFDYLARFSVIEASGRLHLVSDFEQEVS